MGQEGSCVCGLVCEAVSQEEELLTWIWMQKYMGWQAVWGEEKLGGEEKGCLIETSVFLDINFPAVPERKK